MAKSKNTFDVHSILLGSEIDSFINQIDNKTTDVSNLTEETKGQIQTDRSGIVETFSPQSEDVVAVSIPSPEVSESPATIKEQKPIRLKKTIVNSVDFTEFLSTLKKSDQFKLNVRPGKKNIFVVFNQEISFTLSQFTNSLNEVYSMNVTASLIVSCILTDFFKKNKGDIAELLKKLEKIDQNKRSASSDLIKKLTMDNDQVL